MRWTHSLALGAAVGSLLVLYAGTAVAAEVSCGSKITKDTRLTADLRDCPDNGLTIARDGVTLDLNGHTIAGDGELREDCPKQAFCDVGVVAVGHDDVTVLHGTLTDFAVGALLLESRGGTLHGLTVSRSAFNGLAVAEVDRAEISRNAVRKNGVGTDQAGMFLGSAVRTDVTHNVFARNGDIGVYTEDLRRIRFARNRFLNNFEAGLMADGDNVVVVANRVVGNGDGIVIGGDGNVVRGNRVGRSIGCDGECGYGISFESGNGDVIVGNRVSGSANANIRIGFGVVRETVVSRNVVRGAGTNGIEVSPKGVGTRVTGNRADNNGRLGIQAAGGVIDGGRNVASGNGDARQCAGVVCR